MSETQYSSLTKVQKCAAAFAIFARYSAEEVSAEHDVIYAGPNPDKVSREDIDILKELGWRESPYDCFETYT